MSHWPASQDSPAGHGSGRKREAGRTKKVEHSSGKGSKKEMQERDSRKNKFRLPTMSTISLARTRLLFAFFYLQLMAVLGTGWGVKLQNVA